MSKSLFRVGFLGLPVMAAGFAIISACSDDDNTAATAGGDAGRDVVTADQFTNPQDSSVTPQDGSTGTDAADAADAALPPLCLTFKNTTLDAGVDATTEGTLKRYEVIAQRALLAAVDSCEIGGAFPDIEAPPSQLACYAKQLASIAGCLSGGAPIDYTIQDDGNGILCVGAGGDDKVKLGFWNPATGGYTKRDVDFLISLTRTAAIQTGMSTAGADQLKALLEAQRAQAASDAGDGGTFSQSTCP